MVPLEDFSLANINLKNKNHKTGLAKKSKLKMFRVNFIGIKSYSEARLGT